MKYVSINDICKRLQKILANKDDESPETLGGYIVGCTIIPDDIEAYYVDYPVLDEIADLGSDLEIGNYGNKQDGYSYLSQINNKVKELQKSIHD